MYGKIELYMRENGRMDGKGKLVCADGSVYEGDFKGSVPEGIVKYTDVNGNVREGKWRNGGMV
jgi:hypothetical protein